MQERLFNKITDLNERPTSQKDFSGARINKQRMQIFYYWNNLTILCLQSCFPSSPRTPGLPRILSCLTQSQQSRLGGHLLALEIVFNIFLVIPFQEQHCLNIMGCCICAQLPLPRPAVWKLSIAQIWTIECPQQAFNGPAA